MARPAKEFMKKIFKKKIIGSSLTYSSVLDLGCRYGDYYGKFFKNKNYIGVDADPKAIEIAKKKYPHVTFYCYKIEELPKNIKADLVICLQTIGFNNSFEINNTIIAVQKIIGACNRGGFVFFNVYNNCKQFFNEIEDMLYFNFNKVEIINYGRFNFLTNIYIAKIIASLMYFIPGLKGKGSKIYIGYEKK